MTKNTRRPNTICGETSFMEYLDEEDSDCLPSTSDDDFSRNNSITYTIREISTGRATTRRKSNYSGIRPLSEIFTLETIPISLSFQLESSFYRESIFKENNSGIDSNINASIKQPELKQNKIRENRSSYVEDKINAGVPIDKGWAWMIVLGCHLLCLLVSGVNRSHGIFLVEISATFNRSTVDSVWILSLASMLATMLSPFSNSLAVHFSCRSIVFVGTGFIFTGMIITSFSESLELIYFSYGILTGFGYGLIYAPTLCMVGYYFDKFRMLANGISVAGSSLGSMIMPLLVEHFISEYTFKGCFIILAGLMLHLCVVAALCRPMEFYVRLSNLKKKSRSSYGGNIAREEEKAKLGNVLQKFSPKFHTSCNMKRKNQSYHSVLPQIHSSDNVQAQNGINKRKHRLKLKSPKRKVILTQASNITKPQLMTRSCDAIIISNSQLYNDGSQNNHKACSRSSNHIEGKNGEFNSHMPTSIHNYSDSKLHSARKEILRYNQKSGKLGSRLSHSSHEDIKNLFERTTQFVAFHNKVSLNEAYDDSHTQVYSSCLDMTFDSLQNLPNVPTNNDGPKSRFYDAIRDFFQIQQKVITKMGEVKKSKGVTIFDPLVFKKPTFYFLTLTIMISMNIFSIAFMIIPSHAIDMGTDRKYAGRLIQYCGITDFCGRLLTGFIADKLCCSKRTLLLINMALMMFIWSYLLFWGHSYPSLVAFSLMISLIGGSSMSLYAIVVVDRLGLKRLAGAYGMSLFLAGAFSFVHVTFASWIRDRYSNWRGTFILNIILAFFGSCMLICDIIYSKKFENKEEGKCVRI